MENNTGSDQIVWIADFTINESLHEIASSISAAYTRMAINFPDNHFAASWDEQALLWHRYYTNINKMSFKTQEEGEIEIQRIGATNKKVLELEQTLIKKNN